MVAGLGPVPFMRGKRRGPSSSTSSSSSSSRSFLLLGSFFLLLLPLISSQDSVAITDWIGSLTFHNGGSITAPREAVSSKGKLDVVLIVASYREDNYIKYNTRAFYYEGEASIPGPTLRVKPGDDVEVRLINQLEDTGDDDSSKADANGFHSPNTTCLFFHGLRIDPEGNSLYNCAPPGGETFYTFTIPDDHLPGLHWYHDSTHGSSALHVMGGLLGAIVVEPKNGVSSLPTPLNTIGRDLLVLHHVATLATVTGNYSVTPISYDSLNTWVKSDLPLEAEYVDPLITDHYQINGYFQPFLMASPGEMRQLDFVHAVGVPYRLEVVLTYMIGSTGTPVTECTMYLIALDGVYLTKPRVIDLLVLSPAQRASVLITCTTPGIYFLQSRPDDMSRPFDTFGGPELRYEQNLATMIVSGPEVSTPNLPDLSAISRPDYLDDLRSVKNPDYWELSLNQSGIDTSKLRWFGVGEDCSQSASSYTTRLSTLCKYAPFSGRQGEMGNYRHTAEGSGVEEVAVHGTGPNFDAIFFQSGPFQIVAYYPPVNVSNVYEEVWGQIGDWRDTLPTLPGTLVIRYKTPTWSGEYSVQDSFLMNQDRGALDTFWAGTDVPFTIYPRVRTKAPTRAPTLSPTMRPTTAPTPLPTMAPTAPTPYPTQTPSRAPTPRPTKAPTHHPTTRPTTQPTPLPTESPTPFPTPQPTVDPTHAPTHVPTRRPTPLPTVSPTHRPTSDPTASPTPSPTASPTASPTTAPPTRAPTPTPVLEFHVVVVGSRSLLSLSSTTLSSVFGSALGDGSYEVSVYIGAAYTQAPTAYTGKVASKGRSLYEQRVLSAPEAWEDRRGELVEAHKVKSLGDQTMGSLFKYQRIVATDCEETDPVEVPIFFFVEGANLTITQAAGLAVIDAFSTLSFSQIFGQASSGLCSARVLSVLQVASAQSSSNANIAPSPTVITTDDDGGGGAVLIKKSSKNQGIIIAAAIMGTLAIFYGAYLYAKKKQGQEVEGGVLTFRPPPRLRARLT